MPYLLREVGKKGYLAEHFYETAGEIQDAKPARNNQAHVRVWTRRPDWRKKTETALYERTFTACKVGDRWKFQMHTFGGPPVLKKVKPKAPDGKEALLSPRDRTVSVPFYQYQRNEAGLFTELYLPKRAEFQGTLYKVLTEGFDLGKLKAHFRDPGRQPGIRRMLRGYPRVENYTEADVEGLRPLFSGYSLYEVDGVYHSPARRVIEERTQVVRFLLKLDFEELLARCGAGPDRRGEAVLLAREFLRSPTLERESFLLAEGERIAERVRQSLPDYLAGVDYLDRWMNQVRMFLFGYVVHEICARILELHRQERLSAEQLEEEIWFASFSNLSISRVTRDSGGAEGRG